LVEKNDLEDFENKTLRFYYEDGLLDVFIGGFFLLYGLCFIFIEPKYGPLAGLIVGLGTPIYNKAKESITYPRQGYVKLKKETRHRLMVNQILLLTFTGFITLHGLFYMMGDPINAPPLMLFLNRYNLLFIGCIIATLLYAIGRIYHVNRIYRYSIISLLVFSACFLYLNPPTIVSTEITGIPLLINGIIITFMGTTQLLSFVNKYPRRDQ